MRGRKAACRAQNWQATVPRPCAVRARPSAPYSSATCLLCYQSLLRVTFLVCLIVLLLLKCCFIAYGSIYCVDFLKSSFFFKKSFLSAIEILLSLLIVYFIIIIVDTFLLAITQKCRKFVLFIIQSYCRQKLRTAYNRHREHFFLDS